MRITKRLATIALVGIIAAGVAGCEGDISFLTPTTTAEASQSDAPVGDKPAAEVISEAETKLATIAIKGRAPKTGYSRDEFGPAWSDVDRNGCDTRNDILKRDLTNVTFKEKTKQCVILTGTLEDGYTGKTIEFTRGQKTSMAVQIDHRVALSEAWQKGSQQWTPEKRKEFANDPINLKAVDGPSNGSKGDSDLATWLPPNKGEWCDYTAKIIDVKAKYGVWMTKAEHEKAAEILSTCK